jgi:hypothetical protein
MIRGRFWASPAVASAWLAASSCGEPTPAGHVLAGEAGAEGACPAGQTLCSGACVSLSETPAHCGACGQACDTGEICVAGACACAPGLTDCGGSCVNLAADGANCGSCGNACPAPLVCGPGYTDISLPAPRG